MPNNQTASSLASFSSDVASINGFMASKAPVLGPAHGSLFDSQNVGRQLTSNAIFIPAVFDWFTAQSKLLADAGEAKGIVPISSHFGFSSQCRQETCNSEQSKA